MMTTEILVTWVSASVVGVVSLFQVVVCLLEKKRFNKELKDLEELQDSKAMKPAIERLILTWGNDAGVLHWPFVLQALFTVIAFSLLVWWSIYLMNKMFYEWAALSASFALLSVSVTLLVWQGIKYKAGRLANLNVLAETEDQSTEKPSLDKDAKAIVETGANTDGDKPVLSPAKQTKLPEDSVLRRHHMSMLVSQIEDELGERPVDSVLVRHYDHLVLSELMKLLETEEQSHFSG